MLTPPHRTTQAVVAVSSVESLARTRCLLDSSGRAPESCPVLGESLQTFSRRTNIAVFTASSVGALAVARVRASWDRPPLRAPGEHCSCCDQVCLPTRRAAAHLNLAPLLARTCKHFRGGRALQLLLPIQWMPLQLRACAPAGTGLRSACRAENGSCCGQILSTWHAAACSNLAPLPARICQQFSSGRTLQLLRPIQWMPLQLRACTQCGKGLRSARRANIAAVAANSVDALAAARVRTSWDRLALRAPGEHCGCCDQVMLPTWRWPLA